MLEPLHLQVSNSHLSTYYSHPSRRWCIPPPQRQVLLVKCQGLHVFTSSVCFLGERWTVLPSGDRASPEPPPPVTPAVFKVQLWRHICSTWQCRGRAARRVCKDRAEQSIRAVFMFGPECQNLVIYRYVLALVLFSENVQKVLVCCIYFESTSVFLWKVCCVLIEVYSLTKWNYVFNAVKHCKSWTLFILRNNKKNVPATTGLCWLSTAGQEVLSCFFVNTSCRKS